MMYYFYIVICFVIDLIILMENNIILSFHDLWRPIIIFPLLFTACVLIHAIGISFISLFINKNKKITNINNLYRCVTLESIDLFLRIMKVRLHVSGTELLPEKERFMFVSNHISIFDPMIAMLTFKEKELAFVSKKENIDIPFGGRLMLASGCIGLDRKNNRTAIRTIKEAASRITDNVSSIGIYPEGGVNKSDELLLPFHSGSFKLAKKAHAPIVVSTIRNTEQLCRRFLFTSTDVYFDIIDVIPPDFYLSLNTNEISRFVRNEMYNHLCSGYSVPTDNEVESPEAVC